MERIVDGVWEVGIGYVHAHVIEADDGLVLVDTGTPGKAGKIDGALRGIGRKVEDIRTIVLTHWHFDHIGTLGEIVRRSGATVLAHAADAPVIDGSQPPQLTWIMKLTAPIMGKPALAGVDRRLSGDGPTGVPGLTALHTPGHTTGHVSYLFDRHGGVLFAGDVATNMGGRIRRPPRPVTPDMPTNEASMRKLAGLEFDVVVFGHGKALVGGAAARFRDATARM
jgi:glyoxylase-like metal-dependent hydrolase (beta-lactamase superfamily II)